MSLIKPGSGLFSTRGPVAPHLIQGPGGVAKEVNEVRSDIAASFGPLCALYVEEMAAPPAAATGAIVASAATVVTAQVLTGAGLTGTLGPGLITLAYPRNITVTCSNSAGSYAGNVTVHGTDIHGVAQTETIAITNNTTTAGLKAFLTVTEIDIPAQNNASGAIAVGTGTKLGLSYAAKVRTGATATSLTPFKELTDLSAPTAGTIDATNKTYSPNTAPNGTHNYIVWYEAAAG